MKRAGIVITAAVRRLRGNTSGLALIEFAYGLPFFLLFTLTGAELTHYITTRMRVSQLALHIADNAARIGAGTQLQAKRITEQDINDLLIGAQLQSGGLNLSRNGRVILSSLEDDPAHTGKYRIRWQRCYGSKVSHASTYGAAGADNLAGMGPAGRQAVVADSNATMFVELYFEYTPLITTGIHPDPHMVEIASMMVRDRRDLTQVYNTENAPQALCTANSGWPTTGTVN